VKHFNPTSSHPDRAIQAWQILVGKAMNRQSVTYLGLSILMYGKKAAGVLDEILGHIAFFCIDSGLPPLSAIVVGKTRGAPGEGIPLDPVTIDREREKVYDFDWYDICPPSAGELAAAFASHTKSV
jgi:hypothetical protein